MEEIFIAIMERIAEKMPELSYIDEDYGQLEAGAEEKSCHKLALLVWVLALLAS